MFLLLTEPVPVMTIKINIETDLYLSRASKANFNDEDILYIYIKIPVYSPL